MKVISKTKNSIGKTALPNVKYTFPDSEKITISKSNLQIQINKFKLAVKSEISILELGTIVSIWLPIITVSEFRQLGIMLPIEIRAGYVVIAIFFTLFTVWPKFKSMFNKQRVSSDPEEMAKYILDQCNKSII